jgi:serine kinase of HPr protein (carbohydrate metabolism regulator)
MVGRKMPLQRDIVTVERFYTEHASSLGLNLIGGAKGLKRIIREPTVNRPGLALAGFKRYFAGKRVQMMGNAECHYLKTLSHDEREQRYDDLFRTKCRAWFFAETSAGQTVSAHARSRRTFQFSVRRRSRCGSSTWPRWRWN